MIVFIAGMPRSGSTFCFNIARDILRARGDVAQRPAGDLACVARPTRPDQHVLLKSHEADAECLRAVENGTARAVCSLRRPEDAIASWMDVFGQGLDESIAVMRRWIAMYRAIEPYALIVPFARIEHWPLLAARRIARFIAPDAGWAEIAAAARRMNKRGLRDRLQRLAPDGDNVTHIPFSYYETDTFLHRRHIAAQGPRRAAAILGPDQIAAIRIALADELDARGALKPAAGAQDRRPTR